MIFFNIVTDLNTPQRFGSSPVMMLKNIYISLI